MNARGERSLSTCQPTECALKGRDAWWYALSGGVAPGYITRALSGRDAWWCALSQVRTSCRENLLLLKMKP